MLRFKMFIAALMASGALSITAITVQAAPISHDEIDSAVQNQSLIEQVSYRWAGREYCFYDDGWHGPGWYWCGYRLRSGLGWGGPTGWHGGRLEGAIRERDRIGIEERGRVGVERRGVEERSRVGVEQRGAAQERERIGVQERTGREPSTTGRGGAREGGTFGGGRRGGEPSGSGPGAR